MPTYPGNDAQQSPFPRPGRIVLALICTLSGVWLAFAVGVHWAGVSEAAFLLFCGNTSAILHGQLWRVFSAPLLQTPTDLWHLLGALIELYFFGAQLEKTWGEARFVRFTLSLVLLQALAQILAELVLPASVGRYLSDAYWFGALAVTSGMVVASLLSFPNAVIRLYGVLPVSPRLLLILVVVTPLGYLLFKAQPPEGVAGLLAGCFGGWLFGGSTPSPFRRYWLTFRLGRLDAEVAREAVQRRKRVERSSLKVIKGGRNEPGNEGEGGRGPDGRWLN